MSNMVGMHPSGSVDFIDIETTTGPDPSLVMVRFIWVDLRWLKIAIAIRPYHMLILSVQFFESFQDFLLTNGQEEDAGLWHPLTSDRVPRNPAPARIMCCFVALSRLCKSCTHLVLSWYWHHLALVAGTIIDKVYPVQGIIHVTKQIVSTECETQLDQWYLSLPDYLHCDPNSRGTYVPQVIFLHVRYWGCILLLYRVLWAVPFPVLQISAWQNF